MNFLEALKELKENVGEIRRANKKSVSMISLFENVSINDMLACDWEVVSSPSEDEMVEEKQTLSDKKIMPEIESDYVYVSDVREAIKEYIRALHDGIGWDLNKQRIENLNEVAKKVFGEELI